MKILRSITRHLTPSLVISLLETPPSDPERNEPHRVREFAAKFLAPMIW